MHILVAGNLDTEYINALEKHGFNLSYTVENENLMDGLRYHPDMQIARYKDKLICDPHMYTAYLKCFKKDFTQLLPGNVKTKCTYPYDIAYNIKAVGEWVFHNYKYTDSVLTGFIDENKRIHVSQGYSGCSICRVSENAIITADKGIHKSALENNINSLLIKPGYIELKGFDYGFIGGASFNYGTKLYLFGDIKSHPDCNLIVDFCEMFDTEIISLAGGVLKDFGSAITLD